MDWDEELRKATGLLQRKLEEEDPFATVAPRVSPLGHDWTVERVELQDGMPPVGTVLLADPRSFLESTDEPPAAARTGLLPSTETSRREKARLPVVLVTRHRFDSIEGVLLGSWSGKLLGDMGVQNFMTRPLYIGGVNRSGLSMLHAYPDMPGSFKLTEEGLSASDNFDVACDWVTRGPGTALRFKFFWNNVVWRRDEVQELSSEAGIWIPVKVSRDLLLREPDSSFEDPLWVQYADRAGGELRELSERFGLSA